MSRPLLFFLFYLLVLVLGALTGTSEAQQVRGSGGDSATYVYADLEDSYNFVQDQVSFSYREEADLRAVLTNYDAGKLDYVIQDGPLPEDDGVPDADDDLERLAKGLVQFPVLGSAITFVHNIFLPTINGTTPNLNISRTTLACIFAGTVRTWDDAAIKADNPRLMEAGVILPPAEITLVYRSGKPGMNDVLLHALAQFDPSFASLLATTNGTIDDLPPVREGRGRGFPTKGRQFSYFVYNSTKALAYTGNEYAVLLRSSRYWRTTNVTAITNSAGKPVLPSSSSVLSAMRYFEPSERSAPIPKYLIDAASDTAYPLCFWTWVVLRQNVSTARECLGLRAYLNYQVWAISNQRAKDSVPQYGIYYLTSPFQSRVMNILPTISCGDGSALSYSSMSGLGVVSPFVTSWGSFYDKATTPLQITYYQEATLYDGVEQITAGNVDFGTTLLTSKPSFLRQDQPDLQYLPIAAFALSLGYNIPELHGSPPLVLDLYTVSLFYTGEITHWNDSRIQDLNPDAALPGERILLALSAEDSSMVLFSQALAAVNPQIAALNSQANSSISALLGSPNINLTTSVVSFVNRTSYSFGAMPHFMISSLQATYEFVTEALVKNSMDHPVAPDEEGVLAAMREYESAVNGDLKTSLMPTTGNSSYPLSSYAYVIISMSQMTDCTRAQELVQWIWWAITSQDGMQLAATNNIVLPLESTKKHILNKLIDVTCKDVYVNALRPCVSNGTICSDEGTCVNGQCSCNSTRTGTYCESIVSSSDDLSSAVVAGIVVGSVIPTILLMLCLIIAAILIVVFLKRKKEDEEWMIDASEIEFEELIGTGGFGEVRKAVWRGTDVAVKTVASGHVTNDMRNAFIEEVRVMTSLRHPNVVLFMGAATKPPKMCIVMEYMSLGSLYDVLHNELLADIPFQLRIKMMRQAAKGMYFLHSSGIVHRDLKSLNLLLDAKWNVKVSDFGLTKFQDQMKKEGQNQQLEIGSIHWSAPEVLSEKPGIDYEAADVYSFGIILWEVITREDVYAGMSPAAVAVAVLRDDIRPAVPDTAPSNYVALMTNCWDSEPSVRPKFLEIMTRLEALEEKSSGGWGSMSATTSFGWGSITGSSSNTGGSAHTPASNSSDGSTSSDGGKVAMAAGVKPPTGEIAIVFTDVVKAGALWEFNAEAMKDATILHNDTLRGLLAQYKGYEVVSNREGNTGGMSTGGEGSLCIVFQDVIKALGWCMTAQQQLLEVEWPQALLAHPAAAEEWGDTDDRLIFKGLRVRMGVHVGEPRRLLNAVSRRAAYVGPAVHTAARITTMTHGGQIVVSQAVYNKIRNSDLCKEKKRLMCLGTYELPDAPEGAKLYELRARKLEARFFGGTTQVAYNYTTTSDSNPSGEERDGSAREKRLTTAFAAENLEEELSAPSSGSGPGGSGILLGDGDKEEAFLTSANLCRWIIDYSDINIGKQIGMGSYGLVFHGRWKGIEVAVKRFIKQKLTERRLLEFRAEMAFLSELHHPNIVVFIGACVKKPNLCIVTEFVKQGALRDLLYDAGNSGASLMGSVNGRSAAMVKLEWKQRLRMLRSAAAGVSYLHSLEPAIIHRDLKSSNLLVDENWNVKVADFGFARLKEENATMTRCGTPCWTAPEVIRGERYSEKADVYSFGIIMWEVLARRAPFAGRNFMGVSLDVLEGKRPQVPADCPDAFRRMMEKCWHAKPDKRPDMTDVVELLDKLIGDGTSDLNV